MGGRRSRANTVMRTANTPSEKALRRSEVALRLAAADAESQAGHAN